MSHRCSIVQENETKTNLNPEVENSTKRF